jgi:hypothetical protein
MESPKFERVALSRDVSEFLVELSIALHRHSMYPTGHASLDPAVDAVVRHAERLLRDQTSIAIGVARRQLIIGGVTTDPDQPVLRRLAEGLHRHHIGAINVTRGVRHAEVSEALRALASDADRGGAVGLTHTGETSWPHLMLHPLSFDGLALTGEAPVSEDAHRHTRGADLWVDLARAAMSLDPADEDRESPPEPPAVARAIDDHPRAAAYDQVIVGYLLQIARELKASAGESSEDLRRRTSRLVASLRRDTLRRLVAMGGDTARCGQFVRDAADGMTIEAVLAIVNAAADASGQTISHGLMRMLSKLAMHVELGSDLTRSRADIELREQVRRLLDDWRLEDPNPEPYRRVLEHLATSQQTDRSVTPAQVTERPTPLRIVQMCLESGSFGSLAERALDEVLQTGQLQTVFDLLATIPEGAAGVSDAILTRLADPKAVRAMLSGERVDLSGLDHLLPRLAPEAFEPLLDALGSSPNRVVRRRLLELLARTEAPIGPLILARLADERWYVQRNMLMLLGRSGRIPHGFSAHKWTMHPEPRVRSEAIRLQLMVPDEKAIAIATSIQDVDARVVRLGLTAIAHACPVHLMGRVIELAVAPESGDEIRLLAVTALARLQHRSVLIALLRLADGGRSLLGRLRLRPKTPALVAVIRTLAETWSTDPYAAAVLRVAAKSSDPELREAASSTS